MATAARAEQRRQARAKKDGKPDRPAEAPTPPEQQLPAVMLIKQPLREGGFQVVPQAINGLEVDQMPTVIELGLKSARAMLGLPA